MQIAETSAIVTGASSGLCGRAVATWTIVGGPVKLAPFAPLDASTREQLGADADDVTRFLGQ
jgi:hypothetical protein